MLFYSVLSHVDDGDDALGKVAELLGLLLGLSPLLRLLGLSPLLRLSLLLPLLLSIGVALCILLLLSVGVALGILLLRLLLLLAL